MFIGSFLPDDIDSFQSDVATTISEFQSAGVTRLLIDLTNNGGMPIMLVLSMFLRAILIFFPFLGGYVCLGIFLHQYLAGSNFGYAFVCFSLCTLKATHFAFSGFQSAIRANPLAQKIVAADIELGVTSALGVFYPPDNCEWI